MDVTMTTKELLGDGGSERTSSKTTLGRRCRVRSVEICGAPADLCTPAVALTFTSVTQSVCLRPGRRGHPSHQCLRRGGVNPEQFPDGLKVNVASLWTESHVWQYMRRVRDFLYPLFLEGEVDYRLCNAAAHIQSFLSPRPLQCQYCQCFQYGPGACSAHRQCSGRKKEAFSCSRRRADLHVCDQVSHKKMTRMRSQFVRRKTGVGDGT